MTAGAEYDLSPHFTVVGHLSQRYGLGLAARGSVDLLERLGRRVTAVDIPPKWADEAATGLANGGPTDLEYGINLFHLNPPDLLRLIHERPSWLDLKDNLNATVPFWELPRLPRFWTATLTAMDVVLTSSRFIHASVTRDSDPRRCVYYPQSVHPRGKSSPDRQRWGLAPERFVILMSFDLKADIERKNPWGALEAFRRAFQDRSDVTLVIKLNAKGAGEKEESQRLKLLARTAADPRVKVIDRSLDYSEQFSLLASCDVLISLHRAEGLGLVPMEAMSLGKPVVATSWSGNMDYMTESNACLVPYTLVPVAGATRQYSSLYVGHRVRWAEPDVEAAAVWLRRLSENPGLRATIGGKARADFTKWRSRCERGLFLEELDDRFRRLKADHVPGVVTCGGGKLPTARMVRQSRLRLSYRRYSMAAGAYRYLSGKVR
ncbi:MAG: glycosyltransferase family 4 protein [Thermoleophilia bacterium]